jgi:hypothetical protein
MGISPLLKYLELIAPVPEVLAHQWQDTIETVLGLNIVGLLAGCFGIVVFTLLVVVGFALAISATAITLPIALLALPFASVIPVPAR